MTPPTSALFLDFDNVFSHLLAIDASAALRFAREPGVWLERLRLDETGDVSRRLLVLRCYLNPAGTVADPEHPGQRLRFGRLRRNFVDAGFEVVDCPSLLRTKNAADIRMVIDALDAVRGEPRYDEFVLASGDTDLAPLVFRLRALDRRVTVISPADSAPVLGASADELITGAALLGLLRPWTVDGAARFRDLVTSRYTTASGPLNLSTLALELHGELGPIIKESQWFGHRTFAAAVQSLDLPGLCTSQHFLWDGFRHTAPETGGPSAVAHPNDLAARLHQAVKLPSLSPEVWRGIFSQLAEFGRTHEFSISEATLWTQTRLAAQGMDVSRQIIGTAMRGAAAAGCPLYRRPPPGAEEIATAFARNVIGRASAINLMLTAAEERSVRQQLGCALSA